QLAKELLDEYVAAQRSAIIEERRLQKDAQLKQAEVARKRREAKENLYPFI
ncbi:hypothetical protein BDK51DRAFT_12267, partial [Blyttiomyces helicus]